MIYFQLRNVPGGNDFHFGYFCRTKMCICTRKTVVLNALTYFFQNLKSFKILTPQAIHCTLHSRLLWNLPLTARNVNKKAMWSGKWYGKRPWLPYHFQKWYCKWYGEAPGVNWVTEGHEMGRVWGGGSREGAICRAVYYFNDNCCTVSIILHRA